MIFFKVFCMPKLVKLLLHRCLQVVYYSIDLINSGTPTILDRFLFRKNQLSSISTKKTKSSLCIKMSELCMFSNFLWKTAIYRNLGQFPQCSLLFWIDTVVIKLQFTVDFRGSKVLQTHFVGEDSWAPKKFPGFLPKNTKKKLFSIGFSNLGQFFFCCPEFIA